LSKDWRRRIRIATRTLHIGGAAVVLGAATFDGNPGLWGAVLLFSGAIIVGFDLLKYGWAWFRLFMGWSVLLKLALTAVGLAWDPAMLPTIWLSLIVGCVVSHASWRLRHLPFWGEPLGR